MSVIDERLAELGIQIPDAPAPAANYVPYVICGKTLYVSGQIAMADGKMVYTGKVGETVDADTAKLAARLCAINLIAQAKAACGGHLERIVRLVKLGGFVACTPDFTGHPGVINGASDLMVEVFGDRGKHARFAVGAPSLPLDTTVEIEAIFELA